MRSRNGSGPRPAREGGPAREDRQGGRLCLPTPQPGPPCFVSFISARAGDAPSLNVERLGADRLAVRIGRDLVDPRLACRSSSSQRRFKASRARNGNGFLQRHLACSSRVTIDSSSSIGAFRAQLLDVSLASTCLVSTWVFSAILVSRMRHSAGADSKISIGRIVAVIHAPINAVTCAATDSFRPCRSYPPRAPNHPSAGAGIRDIHQLAGDPAKVFGLQIERGQGIAMVRVEAGGDDDQFGAELLQLRQDQIFKRGAEPGAAVLGRQRRIDDVSCSPRSHWRGAWKQRHLVGRAVHHGRIRPENILVPLP